MMQYRLATENDVATLAAMNLDLIQDEGHRNPMSLIELERRMAGWLKGEYTAVLFEESGEKTGYALFRREPDYIYLRQFFVRKECRRHGIGRAAIDWLREHYWRGERVRVEVLIQNVAGVEFWRSVGFADYCLSLELQHEDRRTPPGSGS
jgi:GNAT superfamily N-acetyltransferase